MYFREGLPMIRRKNHELLQEKIVAEVNIGRKKIFMVTMYHSPSQNSEQFEVFMGKLQMIVTRLRQENATAIIITGGGISILGLPTFGKGMKITLKV